MPNTSLLPLPALGLLFLSACVPTPNAASSSAPTATYAGPLLPQNQTARLYCDRNLLVKAVDGNPAYQRNLNAYCNFSLRPGMHLITLSGVRGPEFTFPFQAEEGKTYTLRALYTGSTVTSAALKVLPNDAAFNSNEATNPQP
ncbi:MULTISPECIES: hypothetical protein [Deinococcus]|uniref:DUF4397 domain-containing protein n=1 Tax=Deinococcus cavernae TaxID=2320857 RepID=A0A418V8D5_9DEIO|nr:MULTISPECIES: hypothetical protein [Deinococcus]RJF72339.1 hypothetical protein D3875_13065 [Deinococcus cavernae]